MTPLFVLRWVYASLGLFAKCEYQAAQPVRFDDSTLDPDLWEAAWRGDEERGRDLLVRGLRDPNGRDQSGYTALMAAAHNGHTQIITLLLDQGADPHARGLSGTALVFAAAMGRTEAVRLLLERDAVDREDVFLTVALCVAAEGDHLETMRLLLDAGADVNASGSGAGQNALHAAAGAGRLAAVRLLLERGANPDTAGYAGTPLTFALRRGHSAVVAALRAAGARYDLADAASVGDADRVRALLEDGADPNAPQPGTGALPLLLSAKQGATDVARLLLDHGADPNATHNGYTALLMALTYWRKPIVFLLIERAADVNVARFDGATALHEAVRSHDTATVRALLAAGADVNAVRPGASIHTGRTPLEAALLSGHAETIALLREAGAKPF